MDIVLVDRHGFQTPRAWGGRCTSRYIAHSLVSDPTRVGWTCIAMDGYVHTRFRPHARGVDLLPLRRGFVHLEFQTPRAWGGHMSTQFLVMAWDFRPHARGVDRYLHATQPCPLGFQTPRAWGGLIRLDNSSTQENFRPHARGVDWSSSKTVGRFEFQTPRAWGGPRADGTAVRCDGFQTPRAWGGPRDATNWQSSSISDPTRVGWTLCGGVFESLVHFRPHARGVDMGSTRHRQKTLISDPTRVGWTLDLVVRFVKNILHIVDFGQLREYLTQP